MVGLVKELPKVKVLGKATGVLDILTEMQTSSSFAEMDDQWMIIYLIFSRVLSITQSCWILMSLQIPVTGQQLPLQMIYRAEEREENNVEIMV